MSEKKNTLCISNLNILKLKFSLETRKTVTKLIDELMCEVLFQIHMQINIGIAHPIFYNNCYKKQPDVPLLNLAKSLNIKPLHKKINCPKCSIKINCSSISRHLEYCFRTDKDLTTNNYYRKCTLRARKCIQDNINNKSIKSNKREKKIKPNK